ncbi:hypothetical protein, partial [Neptuniibacter sp.]|uniref:hypothetical protein n=1 Tax=Neptuniibacter sp. TaxID=1962643 RepID=UPI002614C0BF
MAKAKLAGTLLSKLGGLFKKPVVGEALMSGGLNTGLSLMAGANPAEALLYGGADAIASGASLGAVRKLRGSRAVTKLLGPLGTQTINKGGKLTTSPVRSKLELPVNLAASIASTIPVGMILGVEQGAQGAQTKQIDQQTVQRAVINDAPNQLAGAYMPDTLLQNIGLP